VDRSSAEGALVEAPKAPRTARRVSYSPSGDGSGNFFHVTSKWSILILYLSFI